MKKISTIVEENHNWLEVFVYDYAPQHLIEISKR